MSAAPRKSPSPSPAPGSPTLRDLARQLDVSRTTVSLALNNHPRIPVETRQRICALAAKLGYQPDPKVARLMTYLRLRRKSPAREVIAVINNFPQREPWRTNTHLRTVRESLRARAPSVGFAVEDYWLAEPGMTPSRLSGILRARGVAGMVLLAFPHYTATLELNWSEIASVAIGHSVATQLHRVCPHQYRDLKTALKALAALGYRRPGLVLNPDVDQRVEHYYVAAYLVEQQNRAVRDRLAPLIYTEGRDQFLRWFERHQPDALLIAQPPPAQDDVRAWLAAEGLRCPRDIGLALLDVPHDAGKASGIRQAYGAIAAAAVDVVVGQIMRGETGLPALPQIIQLEGQWQDGETTVNRRPASPTGAETRA
jgi:LacI family transcriptional regulator